MRLLTIATAALICAACGQKGPLVLRQKPVATPVVIRSTATPPPPAAPAPKKDDESKTPPQG